MSVRPSIAVCHPFGNANVRAVIESLDEAGMLSMFYTAVAVAPHAPWLKLLPGSIRGELLRRTFPISMAKTKSWPATELSRQVLNRLSTQSPSPMTVARDIDRRTSRELLSQFERSPIAGAYGYEDFCLETFRACNSLGVKRYYDLPIAYWRVANRLMEEEAQRCPAWKQTLTFELEAEHYARKDEELNLADEVFVASDFVKRSLEGSPVGNKPIHVVPFGSPIPMGGPREDNRGNKKLRVLFVGSMGQRKGLADLFAAIRLLARSDIELHVLGSRLAPADFYEQECSSFIYHAPRARSQVLELMRSCDVFVLPSIVEGRALVQQEALSCGLPIVVTANAGGEDLVDEGRTGFLVPIRSPESIADRLAWLADKPDEIPAMRQAAMEKAGQYSWAAYGRHIVAILSGENVGQNVEPSYAVMEGV